MARLEDLITQIEDEALQFALAHEVDALKEEVGLGLVFERHLPESVALPSSAGVQIGDHVRLRQDPERGDLHVRDHKGDQVFYRDGEGVEGEASLADVFVVKTFGESIYPTLVPVGTPIERSTDRPYHAVINAENYHALQLLGYCFAESVDCIYIDPPYNTGARDWKYNNRYVDMKDKWRHSKWLSMMERRLLLAKDLLKPDGVLICTIDEHEVHHLGVLLEQTFREYQIYMVNIVINPKGTNKANFGRVEEHAFFVVPKKDSDDEEAADIIAHLPPPEELKEADLLVEAEDRVGDEEGVWIRDIDESGVLRLPAGLRERLGLDSDVQIELALSESGAVKLRPLFDEEEDEDDVEEDEVAEGEDTSVLFLRRRGAESSFRTQRPNQFYAIKINETTREVVGVGPFMEETDEYELGYREDDVLWVYPIDEEGRERVWRYIRETMQEYIDAGQIRVGTRWDNKPQTYTLNHVKPREGERTQRLRTTWWRTAHDAGTHGTTLLTRLLGTQNPFPFPKSLYAVRDCLEAVVKERPDALIVDFFGGSGTTLHATALLNRADDGRRRCVLVTNNEVDEKTARKLNRAGAFPGDAEYEAHGIFESATVPRISTALTGVRPNGEPVPTGTKFRYLDGAAWADGFEENCEFYELRFLNPDDVELGRAFQAVHPLLWMLAGSQGKRDDAITPAASFVLIPDGGYAVLFEEGSIRELITALNETEAVAHVFLVTDSEDAYAEMSVALGAGYETHMLYRDYLRSFRIRAGVAR